MKWSLLCVLGLFLLSKLLCGNAEEFREKATLTAQSSIIPAGGSVTLTCDVKESTDLKYEWFRQTSSEEKSIITDESGRAISVFKGGNYTCRAEGKTVTITESDSVTVRETVRNRITVTVQRSWSQIFTGDTITLRCEIQGGEGKVWKYEWTAPNTNSPPTSSEYRISRVSVSHSGDYRCRGSSDYLLTGWSDAFRLTVSYKPRATLTAGTTIIPVGGSVTLTCSVQSSDGWKYEWFRRTQTTSEGQIRDQQNRDIRVSEGGIYRCRGTRGNPVYYTDISDDVTIEITISNKVVVKQQPNWPQIFRGETITLTCEVQEGGETTEWEYEWRGPSTATQWTHNNDVTFRVSESSSGDYMCKSRRRDDSYSSTEWSEAFTLSASNKPRATLTAGTTIIPVGGSVTLTCSVQSSDGWKYEWFRRTQTTSEVQIRDQQNRDIRVSEGGIYSCRGTRGNPVYYTDISDDVTIEITFSNKVVVKQQPNWPQIFRGETITLTCEVQEGGETTEWEYEWRGPRTPTQWTHNNDVTFRVSESSSGDYMCKSRRRDDSYSSTEWSEAFTLSVSNKPKAKLRADNTAVPVGGSVTLTCSVSPSSSSGWKYYWYRDEKSSEALTTQDAVFHSNGQISVSQEGLYRCRGGRGNPVYYTEDSQSVRIGKTVTASNRPVVTLYPNWSEIYRGETITVRCEIHGGDTEWDYEWETNSMIKAPNQNEYRIRSASSSNSGNYRCKGRMKSSQHETTEWSDSVTLTVSDNEPRPVLTVSPSWLSPGASVTLNCEVEHPSAGWSFYWYKAVPDLSEKSSSYELLPDGSGTAQDSYIIHGQTHTAGYVCRAGRGDPEYHTDHSQPKFVWSADVHSAASLTVSPDRVQHFTSDSVSLTCEGNFTEWRVRKFSEDGRLYSDCRRMTGSTCDINTSKSDTAVYWCESGSGEFSSAVNITVQNDDNVPILVSPVHPVTEGASVSLSCSLRTQKILSNVFFYHNDKLIENDPRGELKISAVSKSDEGFYKCQYSGRESAQSWMSVKGADSSSPPVWLIVGLVCGVSLIIILLLLLYRCRRTNSAVNEQTLNQDHQQHVYSSLLHGNRCGYEIIRRSENTGSGPAEDVYANVASVIQLKVINKTTGQRGDPEESSDYNNVNLSGCSVFDPAF
ncbi:Fc receptor-like protein 5 [Simochromis diagramma]|uniref:Fc receptor-like protein 5 n=1 Tax=Simochromis diagramma TaxID=43689 RepID=UPI001A7E4C89|nr:Fc receptor-like protein 5 [Simochromis diagramma]